jgi:hypothetical protein
MSAPFTRDEEFAITRRVMLCRLVLLTLAILAMVLIWWLVK